MPRRLWYALSPCLHVVGAVSRVPSSLEMLTATVAVDLSPLDFLRRCFFRPLAYVFCQVFAFLWVCLFCFLAKRISLAIGIIKKAGRAIAAMPLIVLWPLVELVRKDRRKMLGNAAVFFLGSWVYSSLGFVLDYGIQWQMINGRR